LSGPVVNVPSNDRTPEKEEFLRKIVITLSPEAVRKFMEEAAPHRHAGGRTPNRNKERLWLSPLAR